MVVQSQVGWRHLIDGLCSKGGNELVINKYCLSIMITSQTH